MLISLIKKIYHRIYFSISFFQSSIQLQYVVNIGGLKEIQYLKKNETLMSDDQLNFWFYLV